MTTTVFRLPTWSRFALGALVAIAVAAGLHGWLGRTSPVAVAAAAPSGPAARILAEGFPRGRPLVVYLVGPDAPVPARAAPVVRIPAVGGAIRVERGPPPPAGPASSADPVWLGAAVCLPSADVDALDAATRAWLAEVLRAWRITGRLPHGELIPLGIGATPGSRARLVRWLR